MGKTLKIPVLQQKHEGSSAVHMANALKR